jgi:hypothetical protein
LKDKSRIAILSKAGRYNRQKISKGISELKIFISELNIAEIYQ